MGLGCMTGNFMNSNLWKLSHCLSAFTSLLYVSQRIATDQHERQVRRAALGLLTPRPTTIPHHHHHLHFHASSLGDSRSGRARPLFFSPRPRLVCTWLQEPCRLDRESA
jgi:hypothetical protein